MYILYIHITVVFQDTSNAEMEVNITTSLPPFHCDVIYPSAQGFHMESIIWRQSVPFSTVPPLQPRHFLIPVV